MTRGGLALSISLAVSTAMAMPAGAVPLRTVCALRQNPQLYLDKPISISGFIGANTFHAVALQDDGCPHLLLPISPTERFAETKKYKALVDTLMARRLEPVKGERIALSVSGKLRDMGQILPRYRFFISAAYNVRSVPSP